MFTFIILFASCFPTVIHSSGIANQTKPLQGRPLEASDITIGPFIKLSTNIPASSCFGTSVQYTHIIPTSVGTYRVPHSRILMDGKPCGTLGPDASEKQLWLDTHMQLIPIDALFSEPDAITHDVFAAYVQLTTSQRYAEAFFNFSRKDRLVNSDTTQTWIGFEAAHDRVCGDQDTGVLRMPRKALIFFGKNDHIRINLTNLAPRLTTGDLLLQRFHPYHLTFTESQQGGPEHLCPQIYIDRTAQPEQKKVNKCFPAMAEVITKHGTLRMEHLQVGDSVADAEGFSTVFMFTHRQSGLFDFATVLFEGGNITVSHGHYLYTPHGLRAAGSLRRGQRIITTDGEKPVIRVGHVRNEGLYNPQTLSGTIVVNGVISSAYTTAVHPICAHALLAPIRLLFRMLHFARHTNHHFFHTFFSHTISDTLASLLPRGRPFHLFATSMTSSW